MIRLEDLITAYYLARQNKRRSRDSVEFEMRLEARLSKLCQEVNDRTYRANQNYTFVVTRPKPREIFAAEMELRTLHHYIHWRINPLLEQYYSDRTYNNRIGKGGWRCIQQVQKDMREVSNGWTTPAWVIKTDISGCFPNANKDIAYRLLADFIKEHYEGEDKDDILWLIMIMVYANPQNHCYRRSARHMWQYVEPEKSLFHKDAQHGLPIGNLLSQHLMNLYYTEIDKWATEECGLHYCRFVDDMYFVTDNKETFLAYVLPELRKRLSAIDSRLNERKFYCQEVKRGVECLGSVIKCERIYLGNRTVHKAFNRISELNGIRNKETNVRRIIDTFNSYSGMLKTRNGFKTLMRLKDALSEGWWQYVEFDEYRLCLTVKEEYNRRNQLNRKYNLKLKHYDTERKRRSCSKAA